MSIRMLLLCAVTSVVVLPTAPANAEGVTQGRPLACASGAVTGAIGGYTVLTGAFAGAVGGPTLPVALTATAIGGIAGCWIFATALNAMAGSVERTVPR